MSNTDRWLALAVGQLWQQVRLATKPAQRPGYVVAVMLAPPYEALVRWTDAEATFEALDDLVDAR
jgi:hypothetical protein